MQIERTKKSFNCGFCSSQVLLEPQREFIKLLSCWLDLSVPINPSNRQMCKDLCESATGLCVIFEQKLSKGYLNYPVPLLIYISQLNLSRTSRKNNYWKL